MRAYGDRLPLHAYEYDHLIPLELGGAPNSPRNLWPEPGASPNPKDRLENRLRVLVCDGSRMSWPRPGGDRRQLGAAYRRYYG